MLAKVQAPDKNADGIQSQKTENVHIKIEIEIGKPENPTRLRLMEDGNNVLPKSINDGANNPKNQQPNKKFAHFKTGGRKAAGAVIEYPAEE